jgi:cation diffusion facilitator family transporter
MPDAECLACGRRVPIVCIIGNSSLAFYKVVLGILGGSSALLVDGLHSLVDTVGSTNILIASRISRQPPDEDHPYGHGNAEYIGSTIVYSVLLLVTAGVVLSAAKLLAPGHHEAPHFVTLLGAVVSVLVNYLMFQYGKCAGTRCNSPALLADAFENRADAISSLAAVIGIAGAMLIHPICDPIAAAVVGVIIVYNCSTQLKDSVSNLVDRALPRELADDIKRIVLGHEEIVRVDHLRTRRTGPTYWIDIVVELPADLTVARTEEVAEAIRQSVMRRHEHVGHVEVYAQPATKRAPRRKTVALVPAEGVPGEGTA